MLHRHGFATLQTYEYWPTISRKQMTNYAVISMQVVFFYLNKYLVDTQECHLLKYLQMQIGLRPLQFDAELGYYKFLAIPI